MASSHEVIQMNLGLVPSASAVQCRTHHDKYLSQSIIKSAVQLNYTDMLCITAYITYCKIATIVFSGVKVLM